jgi:hypothetical protein
MDTSVPAVCDGKLWVERGMGMGENAFILHRAVSVPYY